MHPWVVELIKGVFNARPRELKYTFIWDEQNVLDLTRYSWSNNEEISLKELTWKLTMLIVLKIASRAIGFHHLNIRHLKRLYSQVVFQYDKLHMDRKKGIYVEWFDCLIIHMTQNFVLSNA